VIKWRPGSLIALLYQIALVENRPWLVVILMPIVNSKQPLLRLLSHNGRYNRLEILQFVAIWCVDSSHAVAEFLQEGNLVSYLQQEAFDEPCSSCAGKQSVILIRG